MLYVRLALTSLLSIVLLAGCGDKKESQLDGQKTKLLRSVKAGDIIICSESDRLFGKVVADNDNATGMLRGLKVQRHITWHMELMSYNQFATCDITVIRGDDSDAAGVIGAIFLGRPLEPKSDLLVAPDGTIVKARGFTGRRTAHFISSEVRAIIPMDSHYECALGLARRGKSYDADLCEGPTVNINLH